MVLEVELRGLLLQVREGHPGTSPASRYIPETGPSRRQATENHSSPGAATGGPARVGPPLWDVGRPSWGRQGDLTADTGPG